MRISGNIHRDLIKLQAEFGARHSYRKAATDLKALTGTDRTINNRSRIHRTTNEVGKKLAQSAVCQQQGFKQFSVMAADPAERLYAAVDGGHVHDANNKGHNFEAMIGKVYRPENVQRIDKHHTRIIQKHCVGSAKFDKQETMKANLIAAAKKEGVDKDRTEVTVLADGAKNCWNIAEALREFCFVLICILDWFHIGKNAQTLKGQLPVQYRNIVDEAKTELWFGRFDSALKILNELQLTLKSEAHIKKVENFYVYIKENKKHLINYDERKRAGLIYTSHVAESTVEHLLNERSKRKQKMQWSRDGLHAVLQIRATQASNEWESAWNDIVKPHFKAVA